MSNNSANKTKRDNGHYYNRLYIGAQRHSEQRINQEQCSYATNGHFGVVFVFFFRSSAQSELYGGIFFKELRNKILLDICLDITTLNLVNFNFSSYCNSSLSIQSLNCSYSNAQGDICYIPNSDSLSRRCPNMHIFKSRNRAPLIVWITNHHLHSI